LLLLLRNLFFLSRGCLVACEVKGRGAVSYCLFFFKEKEGWRLGSGSLFVC